MIEQHEQIEPELIDNDQFIQYFSIDENDDCVELDFEERSIYGEETAC